MTANEKRIKVRDTYKQFIGRNHYSQAKRNCCLSPASDGKYYSDCSSSVSYAYKAAGFGFGILNTVGMYQKKDFTDVPVTIVKGQITNPEVLRIGDMLLYAGNDSSRSYAGYVGHVEMIGEISGSKYTLYGHGSGLAKKTDMVSKNKSRYNTKASTKLGNRGLIKVKRFIQDDTGSEEPTTDETETATTLIVKPGTWNLRKGPGTEYDVITTVAGGATLEILVNCQNGWYCIKANNITGYISGKAVV